MNQLGDKELFDFLVNAPKEFKEGERIRKFQLKNGEHIHCVLWNMHFYITGTDIVKILVWRFQNAGRALVSLKKFEEGVFSDLRNLKPGIDSTLEGPRSEFLEFLYKNGCIRTQKKQKVFFWYSVPHDALFCDALERDLRRETNLFTYNKYMGNFPRNNISQGLVFQSRHKRTVDMDQKYLRGKPRPREPDVFFGDSMFFDPKRKPPFDFNIGKHGNLDVFDRQFETIKNDGFLGHNKNISDLMKEEKNVKEPQPEASKPKELFNKESTAFVDGIRPGDFYRDPFSLSNDEIMRPTNSFMPNDVLFTKNMDLFPSGNGLNVRERLFSPKTDPLSFNYHTRDDLLPPYRPPTPIRPLPNQFSGNSLDDFEFLRQRENRKMDEDRNNGDKHINNEEELRISQDEVSTGFIPNTRSSTQK